MIEIFKKVWDCKHYEISNKGRLRSLTRTIIKSNGRSQLTIGGFICKDSKHSHLKVNIRRTDGTIRREGLHRLVAEAFLDNEHNKPIVRHIDGNSRNNCVDNLSWSTYAENNQDTVKHGNHKNMYR